MTKQERLDAIDAGYDYAAQYLSERPNVTYTRARGELEACMFDLAGGDEAHADYCWEGALRALKEKFSK